MCDAEEAPAHQVLEVQVVTGGAWQRGVARGRNVRRDTQAGGGLKGR